MRARRIELRVWFWVAFAILIAAAFSPSAAKAADCNEATSPGGAPSSWQTYCWLDLDDYNDTTARSAGGQSFSVNLSDGSTLNFTLRTTSSAATGAVDVAAPSWTGAAVGNSSFLGIPGKPILYMLNSGSTVTFEFSGINVTPPPGVTTVSSYAFVVADAESTDNSEFLEYTTNGSPWQVLDAVPPTSGSQMPGFTGAGTATFRETGDGLTGSVGAYIVGSDSPTTVSATMNGAGLQGLMFAVRFASISLNKIIDGARITPNDQFEFSINAASSATVFATGVTSGTGLGPFPAAVLSTASGIPLELEEVMASGSDSSLAQYQSSLTCTNASAGSSTVMPTGVITTNYSFGALQFGDEVECNFTNTPFPHVTFTKVLDGARVADTDQFRLRIRDRTDNFNVAQPTTTGTGSTLIIDSTGPMQVTSGNDIRVREFAQGTTTLGDYSISTVCTNANAGSTTVLGSGTDRLDFVPAMGDVITCIVTNSTAPNAVIIVEKTSALISDPISSPDPMHIPLAIMEYTITVRNEGAAPVDLDSLEMFDELPPNVAYQTTVPLTLTDGATASGLDTFNAATMVGYSIQTGGVAPYSHTPTGSFDSAVSGILVTPEGVLAASDGTNHPSFTIRYRVRIE